MLDSLAFEQLLKMSGNWSDKRWEGVTRVYTKADVERLRGSIKIEHTLARMGAERFWNLVHTEPYVPALGALTGGQAVEMVQGGERRTAYIRSKEQL